MRIDRITVKPLSASSTYRSGRRSRLSLEHDVIHSKLTLPYPEQYALGEKAIKKSWRSDNHVSDSLDYMYRVLVELCSQRRLRGSGHLRGNGR